MSICTPLRRCSTPWCATACMAWWCMGTCGENNSLEPEEKRAILAAAVEVVAGRVPIVAGVSELTTARAVRLRQATPSGSGPTL